MVAMDQGPGLRHYLDYNQLWIYLIAAFVGLIISFYIAQVLRLSFVFCTNYAVIELVLAYYQQISTGDLIVAADSLPVFKVP